MGGRYDQCPIKNRVPDPKRSFQDITTDMGFIFHLPEDCIRIFPASKGAFFVAKNNFAWRNTARNMKTIKNARHDILG